MYCGYFMPIIEANIQLNINAEGFFYNHNIIKSVVQLKD